MTAKTIKTAKTTNVAKAIEDMTEVELLEQQLNEALAENDKRWEEYEQQQAAQAFTNECLLASQERQRAITKAQAQLNISNSKRLDALEEASGFARKKLSVTVKAPSFAAEALEAVAIGVVAGVATYGTIMLINHMFGVDDEV